MSEYKTGDLVQHIPSGCVGEFSTDLGDIIIYVSLYGERGAGEIVTWDASDCRPYVDPHVVVDAAENVCRMAQFSGVNGERVYIARSEIIALRKAIAAYDSATTTGPDGDTTEADHRTSDDVGDYKWLAMDKDGTFVFKNKPEWNGIAFEIDDPVYSRVIVPPDFLKTCQLWERMDAVDADHPPKTIGFMSWEDWRGYWWRKVVDYGQPEQPTPLLDTLEAQPAHNSIEVKNLVDAAHYMASLRNGHTTTEYVRDMDGLDDALRPFDDRPGQPKTCAGCAHYAARSYSLGRVSYEGTLCWAANKWKPIPGMPGCVRGK